MNIPGSPPDDDENTAFLLAQPNDPPVLGQSDRRDDTDSELCPRTRFRILITLIVILLSFEIGGQMIPGPMVRIIETIACDNYWRRHDPARLPPSGHLPEHLCKIAAVQTEVATVKGYSDLFEGLLRGKIVSADIVKGAICAIPYGILADKYGRRRAIRLTVPGFLLNSLMTNSVLWFSNVLPLRAIWLASLSWTIGGGPPVALVVIWTMLADLTTDQQRASLFFRVGLASQVASLLASVLSSELMTLNPWIPLLFGCGTVTMGLACAFSLPETMGRVKASEPAETARSCSDEPLVFCKAPWDSESAYLVPRKIARLISPYLFIFNRHLLLLLFSFATAQLAHSSSSFLTQYISTRFSWALARSNLLTALYIAITIPVFLFLLPFLSRVFDFLPQIKRDLQVARFSDFALTLGSFGIGLSPSIILLIPSICLHAIGAGFVPATRSVITALVKQEETARLYSVIEILQMVGGTLGSLCFTKTFSAGLRMGGVGAGLVWILSSLLYALVGLALMLVHV
ncbi:MFS transporter [Penicillium sp. DV-2018c]|nr:MFS transporter [Penicillium sp. DV-2018c]KAJ5567549.1 MFS transporter [Penicillium sp. DV-2018c]